MRWILFILLLSLAGCEESDTVYYDYDNIYQSSTNMNQIQEDNYYE